MSQAPIEVECPGCQIVLELDPGFAGGVCRCAKCATLLTVPTAEQPRAERVQRPEAPEGPGSSVAFQTPSGRTVRVADLSRVPLAPVKRKAVRAVTGAVFFAAVGGLLVLAGVAVYQIVSEPSAEQVAAETYVETFTYDPDANPLEIEAPNLFGLPLANTVAVIYDTTGINQAQRSVLDTLLLDGLRRVAPSTRVTVFLAQADGRTDPLIQWHIMSGTLGEEVAERLARVPTDPKPEGSLLPAIREATEPAPDLLIVVTARAVSDDEGDALVDAVDPRATRVDAVLLDTDSYALEDATRSTGGHFVTLDTPETRGRWLPPE